MFGRSSTTSIGILRTAASRPSAVGLPLHFRGEPAVSGTGRPRRCGAGEEDVVKLKLDFTRSTTVAGR
jgi:hypothetical protein